MFKTITSIFTILLISGITIGQPATQPAADPVTGTVLEVTGKYVQHTTVDQPNRWINTQVGDTLQAGSLIRTGLKSSIEIQLHTAAIVQLRSASRAMLSELARTADAEITRVDLEYGTIRAGIIEHQIESDFTIACPVAVLSREGTWGIEMNYDPATTHYYAGLDTDGLIRVRNLLTGQQRVLTPGQFVTQAMQLWVNTAVFQRTVLVTDPFGTTQVERTFYAQNPGGRTALDPTGSEAGQTIFRVTTDPSLGDFDRWLPIPPSPEPIPTYYYRFGDFGTGIPEGSGFDRLLKRREK